MTASPDFSDYLSAIATQYAQWWERYTLMDAVGREQVKRQTEKSAFPFDFGLMVQTAKPVEEKEKGEELEEKLERLPVLAGMRKYAAEHILLVGRPGSGKSTALIRLLLEEAENESAAAKIPVLVELRYWQTSVIDRILTVLQQGNCLDLDADTLKTWLRQGRLLLLMDGLNELPSEEARRDVATFRRDYLQTPMIFTTRELSVGGDLGITKKLEMQPLTEAQMQDFVRAYLPLNQAEQMLRQLKDRLRELGQTPLLLWMLCGLFQRLGTVPPNLGMVFRQFTQGYERSLKEDIPVTAESRRWWSLLLQRLAFTMMQGENPQEKPTELQVAIAHQTAEDILTQYLTEEKFDKPRDFAKQWLEDLLKHHLIQINGDKIEFRHQLIQEYYAAEYLLRQLPKLSDVALQRQYLNYLKWTEAIALMLALVEDEGLAVRVVELAIRVDLMLGARLAGEVKQEFQGRSVEYLYQLTIENGQKSPCWLRIELLGKSQSDMAISKLIEILRDEAFEIMNKQIKDVPRISDWRKSRFLELKQLDVSISSLLKILQEQYCDDSTAQQVIRAVGKIATEQAIFVLTQVLEALRNSWWLTGSSAVNALREIGSERVISGLQQAMKHKDSSVRCEAIEALAEIDSELVIPILLAALDDKSKGVRCRAVKGLGKIQSKSIIPGVLKALNDLCDEVYGTAIVVSGQRKIKSAIPTLRRLLQNNESWIQGMITTAIRDIEAKPSITLNKPLPKIIHSEQELDIEKLLSDLKSEAISVRRSAASSLEKANTQVIIPELSKALKDPDPDVRRDAAFVLAKLGSKLAILELSEVLLEFWFPDYRYEAAKLLGELQAEEAIPHLTQALLNDKKDIVRQGAAEALGKIGSELAIPELTKALKDPHGAVQIIAAEALAMIGTEPAVVAIANGWKSGDLLSFDAVWVIKRIPEKISPGYALTYLSRLIPTETNASIFEAIASIQARCKFYNYEIFQAAEVVQTTEITVQTEEDLIHDKLDAIAQGVQQMSDVPKYNFPNAQKVQIFEKVDTYIENNSAIPSEEKEAIAELKQVIQDLQTKYPNARPEQQSIIIEAEFQEIKQKQPWRWKNLLNYKRLLNGGKTAAVKVGEHFAEESPWGKGAIAFLEGVTEDVE